MSRLPLVILSTIFSTSLVVPLGNVADANHATLKVVNTSSQPIVKFYASPSYSDIYTGDLLGRHIIYPGQFWSIDLSDGKTDNCIYDVRVILRNGKIFEDRLNVCGQTLTIYNQ